MRGVMALLAVATIAGCDGRTPAAPPPPPTNPFPQQVASDAEADPVQPAARAVTKKPAPVQPAPIPPRARKAATSFVDRDRPTPEPGITFWQDPWTGRWMVKDLGFDCPGMVR